MQHRIQQHRDFPIWEQSASRVLYYFASSVGDQLLSYIWDAKIPDEVWGNLKKILAASTTAKKLNFLQEFSNVRQKDLSVADYTTRIKYISHSLAFINVTVDEDEMVQICFGGLVSKFGSFRMSISMRKKERKIY